jgi:glucose-1-phosphate thymidylyltransferase
MLKCLITAAGLGTRSGLDGRSRKEMLPIYDYRGGKLVLRPMVDCIITQFMRAGIKEFVVVLDPKDHATRDYLKAEFKGIDFVYQETKNGFGDAVRQAKNALKDESFILNAGDGILLDQEFITEFVRKAADAPLENHLVLMEVDNPKRYGVASCSKENDTLRVSAVVEKPEVPPSNLALCALYALNPKVMENLEETGKNIELTPAINKSITEGVLTNGVKVDRALWVSVGIAEEYATVLKRTLDYSKKVLSAT